MALSDNDGCVIARSREAAGLGIARGAPWFRVRDAAARLGVVARSPNYELHGSLSHRLMELLRTLSPAVEAHSIDEAFVRVREASPDALAGAGRRIRAGGASGRCSMRSTDSSAAARSGSAWPAWPPRRTGGCVAGCSPTGPPPAGTS